MRGVARPSCAERNFSVMVEKGSAAVDEVLLLIACLTVILGNRLHDSGLNPDTRFSKSRGHTISYRNKTKTPESLDSGVSAMAEREEFNFGGARFDALFLKKLNNLQSASVKNATDALF